MGGILRRQRVAERAPAKREQEGTVPVDEGGKGAAVAGTSGLHELGIGHLPHSARAWTEGYPVVAVYSNHYRRTVPIDAVLRHALAARGQMTNDVTATAIRTSKPVLLTVDDDRRVSQAIAHDLKNQYGEHFRILRTESGAAALEVLRQLKLRGDDAALLLADYRMPEMDGVSFLKHSMELFPEAKRALLTAYADTNAAIQAINQVQLHHYLLKPWDPPEEQLFPVIDDLLDDWVADYRPAFEGVRVIGHHWSARSHEVKDFLARNLVPWRRACGGSVVACWRSVCSISSTTRPRESPAW
jgi:CheY-like chemotaxis protein